MDRKETVDGFLGPAWEHQHRPRIQFARRHHRGKAVEVGMEVCRNDVHNSAGPQMRLPSSTSCSSGATEAIPPPLWFCAYARGRAPRDLDPCEPPAKLLDHLDKLVVGDRLGEVRVTPE